MLARVPRLQGQYRTAFFHTETTEKYPSFADSLRLPVHRGFPGIIEAGLWECNIGWSPSVPAMPILHRLHWLDRAPERISFKLVVLAFRCLEGLTPTYLTDSLQHVADLPGRQRLRNSASSMDLVVATTDTSPNSLRPSVLCCGGKNLEQPTVRSLFLSYGLISWL